MHFLLFNKVDRTAFVLISWRRCYFSFVSSSREQGFEVSNKKGKKNADGSFEKSFQRLLKRWKWNRCMQVSLSQSWKMFHTISILIKRYYKAFHSSQFVCYESQVEKSKFCFKQNLMTNNVNVSLSVAQADPYTFSIDLL